MAKTPKTFETAKVGETYTSAAGQTFKRVQSPYDPKNTISVLMQPGAVDGNAPVAPSRHASPAAPPADTQPPAVVEQAAATPPAPPPEPPPAPEPEVHAPQPDDNVEAAHLAELQQRQVAADAQVQAVDDFHAQLDAAPKPTDGPQPAPTVVPKMLEAGFVPNAAAAGDIARGVLEAPDMVISGAKHAIRNLIGFSDHLGDLVEEHVPGTVYFSGFDHLGEPGNKLSVSLDTAANHAAHGLATSGVGGTLDTVLPDGPTDHPHSVTGGLIQSASQFATGMVVGNAALRGWKAAAGAGAVAKSMAAGALSDFGAFDAHQQRLSDLLKTHAPDAIKPVLDYLASDPRDTETEGRFKNALEGLGLGAAMHTIISAVRHLRSARMIQRAAALSAQNEGLQGIIDAPQTVVEAEAAKFHADLHADVGDPSKSGFTIKRKFPLKPGEVAATADAGEMGPNTIGLNYTKIADETDMQAAAVQFYDAFHGEITDAKRGVQSIDKQVRDAFGEDVSKLLGAWAPGTAMVSHELTALRFAQAAATRDFMAHARAIAAGDSSLAKQAAFLQTGGVLDALTRAVEGGKAEAARTLRTLRETIPSMTGDIANPADAIEFYRKVDALVAGAGGKEMVERAAKAFLTVAQANPLGTSKFLRFIQGYGKFADGAKEHLGVFLSNGLLSIPGNVANVVGNASALVWEPMMRGLAPHLSDAVGAESHVADGEAIAMMAGMKAAFGDIFRLGQHINGALPLEERYKAMGAAIRDNMDRAKSNTKGFSTQKREEVRLAEGIEHGPESDTALGRVSRLFWSAIKIPGQANGLMDDLTKIIAGRAELHAQSYRQAIKDMDTGLITREQVGTQMQKYIEDPSADTLAKVIYAQKELSWTRAADTSAGDFTKALSGLRAFGNAIPIPFPLGTSILPFVRTPANVFSYGVRNSIFAPLSARWFDEMRSADGATRQLALTKYAAGSLLSLWVIDHVAAGEITGGGPRDPVQKQTMMRVDPDTHRTLWQPYSIKLGDRWFDYSRLDPAATPMAIAADVAEPWLGNDWSDAHAQTSFEAFASGSMAAGSAFLNKSTMQGLSQLMDAITSSQQGSASKAATFLEKRAVAMTPFSSVLGSVRRHEDPYQREVSGLTDAFKNQVPGLSATLPASFDLWGRTRTYESGMGSIYDFLVPARTHPMGGEPADREMIRLGFAKQMPSKDIALPGGLNANLRNYPRIYNEILTRGGPEALNEINDLVTGASPNSDYYNGLADGSDPHAPGSKARYIENRLNFHYSQAVRSVKQDFAEELQAIAAEQAGRKAEARAGP